MFWLLLFGLAHAHLTWYGDILYTYALCGMIVYWAAHWKPRSLILAGCLVLLVPAAIMSLGQLAVVFSDESTVAKMGAEWMPAQQAVDEELATYRGSWLEQLGHRSEMALMMQTFVFGVFFFWRAGGLMLIGMALFKLKILDGSRSTSSYSLAAALLLPVGLGIVGYGIWRNTSNNFAFESTKFGGTLYNYFGSLLVSGGYVCVIMLMFKHNWFSWLQHSFKAIGQLALTNYLLQTIVCTFIFYGHGPGYFGSVSRTGQFAVVVTIWVVQMILSPIWAKHFRFGPFEWLWRSLVYWKIQPMRRLAA